MLTSRHSRSRRSPSATVDASCRRPFTLGAAFKVTGAQGLSRTPLKREYARHDWQRLARLKNVPFNPPADHPKVGLPGPSAPSITSSAKNARTAARLAKTIIVRYLQGDTTQTIRKQSPCSSTTLGIDPDLILAGIPDPEVKAIARRHSEDAISRGVFGSPWIFVDGEPFWGSDRLAMVERWLAEGPW